MKHLFTALLLLAGFSLFSQNTQSSVQKALDRMVTEEECAGIAASILVDDSITWSSASGEADTETGQPFTVQTIVRTASITKPMTAISIMQLVEQGKITLDDKVSDYIPAFAKAGFKDITILHVLQHSSGMGAYKNNKERNNKDEFATLESALVRVLNKKLLFTPGSDFAYTSYGYTVLGVIIEQVSGLSYEDYLQQFIFDPAGMTNSSVEGRSLKAEGRVEGQAQVYHQHKKGKIKHIKDHNISDRLAGGGVLSTAQDLLKFGNAVINNTLITEGSLDLMTTDYGLKKENNGYGLGWYLYGENDKFGNIYGHNGAQYGCSSFMFIFPRDQIVTAVVSNTSGIETGSIALAIHDIAMQLKTKP